MSYTTDNPTLNTGVVNTLFGRRQIFTSVDVITRDNVISVVNEALSCHILNLCEEDYLYWYRRGLQPILARKKEIRPEINNKIVVNNANQVVVFKNGYFLTKPAFYVSRKEDEEITQKVKELNEYLYTSGKQQADNEVVNWFHTVGVGALLIEPNRENRPTKPVNVYSLDPRSAFVVYSLRPGNRPVMGVNMVIVDDEKVKLDVFTEDAVYRISGGIRGRMVTNDPVVEATAISVDSVEPNPVGEIPIVEYTYNENRMGAFENAIPLMDAINLAESNRLDGVEQFIQSLCVAVNCDFEEGVNANTIRQAGMIKLKNYGENKADFKILSEQLDQSQTQVTIDDLYTQMLEKCAVPSSVRDGGSTSDNVGAVYLRSGWALADTAARNTEDLFKVANKRFDKVFLNILKRKTGLEIDIDDFELQFTRNEMSNLLVKTQGAMNMKELGFAPEIAFARSGLSNDPLNDIAISRKYIDAKWGANDNAEVIDENRTDLVADGLGGEVV